MLPIAVCRENNEDLDLVILDHHEWGKGFIKKCKISPDAFIQLALQLAYYRDAGRFVQTYEASMTRLYLCGRTETVRSCTQEAVDFVRSLLDDAHSTSEKHRLVKLAAEKHQQLYRDAMNGKGIDRHLFALYVCCKGLGYKSPFLEKILMRPWTLSTSQQPQQQLSNVPDANLELFQDKVSPGGGFGPVSDDGYGVSYMLPSDHKIFFHITSKHSSSHTSSKRFAENIRQGLQTLRELFEGLDSSG
ncbi:Carnitine O-palmitoyltransferase 1, liver isoform [Orchesella cincta]|uniref:Carnitine O-palmitoyltransferase 1, liver isoform n=1 Tax=Orchesella cincta TaxID=48709 RepID=A0A1D2N9C0_ORCCI|nr:Carnitine O-palmitoyltransferase 1, liver isoform [Orchesella cincta]